MASSAPSSTPSQQSPTGDSELHNGATGLHLRVDPPADFSDRSSGQLVPDETSASHQRDSSRAPQLSRRRHAKSKTGCRTCKRRKVKCDEERPSCRNCVRYAVTCDFSLEHKRTTPTPAGHIQHSQHAPQKPNEDAYTALNMVDLELLHNFTTFTHATLSSDNATRQMFRTTAIRMAFGCEFLMRTILAASAVHLAHFRRDKHDFYVEVGLNHHQVACQLAVSKLDDLNSLTQQDCENLHLFSLLSIFFSLGCPKHDDDTLVVGEAVIPSWLGMVRSSEPTLKMLDPQTYKGALSPIFEFGRSRWRIIHDDSHHMGESLLVDLQTAVNQACDDPQLSGIYNGMIEKLRRVLSMLGLEGTIGDGTRDSDGDATMSPATPSLPLPKLQPWDIFVLQWDAAKDFIPLLRGTEPRQEAIAIYAHFLIIFKKLESHWWLEGWAKHIMERVWASLDEEHRLWVQWPIEELGWIPPTCIGIYPIHPGVQTWNVNNSAGAGKRAVAITFLIGFGNIGGIFGSYIYKDNEADKGPYWYGASMAFGAAGVVSAFALEYFLWRSNKCRALMTEAEVRDQYTDEEPQRLGDKSPLVRYTL